MQLRWPQGKLSLSDLAYQNGDLCGPTLVTPPAKDFSKLKELISVYPGLFNNVEKMIGELENAPKIIALPTELEVIKREAQLALNTNNYKEYLDKVELMAAIKQSNKREEQSNNQFGVPERRIIL